MKFSLFTIAMMAAAVNAVPIHNDATPEALADMDLMPRAARSIIAANGCCEDAGCKRARSVLEPYCPTGCYNDKPWLHLPCKGDGKCNPGCGADGKPAADKAAGAAGAAKSAGAKAAEDAAKKVDTGKIAAELTKALK